LFKKLLKLIRQKQPYLKMMHISFIIHLKKWNMKSKLLLFITLLLTTLKIQSQSVVDIIVNSPDHNTLEAAVVAADLATTLQGPGPFTVFAPTDAAFAAQPAGTVEALLADPQGALTDILLYHTVAANALSSGLNNGQFVKTINGKSVSVKINADGVFINNAKVTVADVIADNGVVHVIDAVILPPINRSRHSPKLSRSHHSGSGCQCSRSGFYPPGRWSFHRLLHQPMLPLPHYLQEPSKPCWQTLWELLPTSCSTTP
jgi:uncharacterized surface protein with fasciclin (FAS1) repeats